MLLKQLKRDERGTVLIELGMALPVLFALLVGLVEITMLLSTRFKISNTANQIALPASVAGSKIDEAQLADALEHLNVFVSPITDFGTNGNVIIAAVQGSATAGVSTILWNRCGGGPALAGTDRSLAAADGSNFSMPDNLDLGNGLTAIVVKTSYKYHGFFLDQFIPAEGKIVTKTYVQRSRYGEYTGTVANASNLSGSHIHNC
jgi:TadE-like protein